MLLTPHIFFKTQFLPETQRPMTPEEAKQQVFERREILRKHRDHEAVRAMGEMLELQAASACLEAIGATSTNRDYDAGWAAGMSYMASLLKTISTSKPEQPGPPEE